MRMSKAMTQQPPGLSKSELDKQLDEALEETFPASDTPAVGQPSTEPDRPLDRRPARIDQELVAELARQLKRRFTPRAR